MKKAIIVLTVLFFTILSCQKKECTCESDPKVVIKNDSLIHRYMNVSITPFRDQKREVKLLNYIWDKYNEPVLHIHGVETYRFSIGLFSFGNYFKIYRIGKKGNSYNSETKVFGREITEYGEDSLIYHVSKEISKIEWQEITKVVEENCFWTIVPDIKSDDQFLDPAWGWRLEGFKNENDCTNSNYHIVTRNYPDSSEFIFICEKIMELDTFKNRSILGNDVNE
ncbi:MAG: hypothetical protein AB8F94_14250 [Saprospiraceae bacterium]